MRRLLLSSLALAAASTATAQELSAYGGALRVDRAQENSFSVGAAYTHGVNDHVAVSLSYLNEGHPTDHHRDGVAGQVWLRSGAGTPGWSFAVGAGQYYYFDTTELHSSDPAPYTNDHGRAAIYSLQTTYQWADSRWYSQLQLNRIAPHGGKDATTALMAGVGYRFNGVKGDKLHLEDAATDEALTLLAGQRITNSLASERERIGALEYRRAAGRYVDWTVTAINEGDGAGAQRNGVATQLWLIRSLTPRVELGAGAGFYFNAKVPDGEGQRSHKAGLVSVAGRYHLSLHIVAEALFNRVVTDYHRDADLLLIGLGYTF